MQQMGRYQVLRRLGGGGFGEVFLAEDPSIDRQVAIKVFRPKDENLIAFATSSDEEGLAILRGRFLNEARILASLDNAIHVVNVLDFGELDDGAPYYVMPYLPHSLADELGRDVFDVMALEELPADQHPRAPPVERSLDIFEQILKGLAAAHGRGLVHRDIKPSNIMLTEEGEVRLVDFGIAKAPDGQYSTVSHLGMGSRNYMAPEQRESAKHVDARADLYAAGVVAYRMLVGKLPIGRFADPNVVVPALGQAMNDFVLRLMAADRGDRPEDAGKALQEFDRARSSVGQVESGSATGTWVGDTGASDIRDELKPLRARIVELIADQGRIGSADRDGLIAMAAIADLDETGLNDLIKQLAKEDKTLAAKQRLAGIVHTRVQAQGAALGDEVLASYQKAAEAVGWDEGSLKRIMQASLAELHATGKPAAKSSPRASSFSLPLKPILAGLLVIVLIAASGFSIQQWRQGQIVEGERLALLEAARAEESQAWQQAESTDSIEAYRQYLGLWPDGSRGFEAETRIARLEDAARQSQMSEAERQRELVSSIQIYLNRLGFRVPESGQLDTRTEAGIRTFEEAQQLLITGNADEVLQTALIEEFDRRDKAAWQHANNTDTEAAYGSYREQFPQGSFLAEVDRRIESVREKAAAEEARRQAAAAAEEQRRREELAAAEAQRQLVLAVQTELSRLGRYVEVDGVVGDGTRDQILAFERATDRTQLGEASQAMLDAMKATDRWPRHQPGERFRDCDNCPEMVVIPGGAFQMGSPSGERDRIDNEGPLRQVRVPAFALARTPVTVAQFRQFVEATEYRTDAESDAGGNAGCFAYQGSGANFDWQAGTSWRNPGFIQGDDHPVTCVSWNDVQAYLRWLSNETANTYRLPSEAEQEYALRAGTTSIWPWGNDPNQACQWGAVLDQRTGRQLGIANESAEIPDLFRRFFLAPLQCDDGHLFTAPVANFKANMFGLHDTSGNVWEWGQDCWNDGYRGAPSDGSAWMTGDCSLGVLRGGSWQDNGQNLRSAHRNGSTREGRDFGIGFRPARAF